MDNLIKTTFNYQPQKLHIWAEAGNLDEPPKFDLTPRNYLSFSKDDLKCSDQRSLVNSMSNSKRAIDCQVELFFKAMHIDLKIKDQLKHANSLINCYSDINHLEGANISIKLIQAMDIAPIKLISKIRKIRNLIEHDYKFIKKPIAEESFEIATFLVNTIENVINSFCTMFYLYHNKKEGYLTIYFNNSNYSFEVTSNKSDKCLIIGNKTEVYMTLVRSCIHIGFKNLCEKSLKSFLNMSCCKFNFDKCVFIIDPYWPPPSWDEN